MTANGCGVSGGDKIIFKLVVMVTQPREYLKLIELYT